MTITISTGIVTFHDFDCLVFQGDNGGPLVYLETDGVYTQVGIGTFLAVVGCQSEYPAVFTRVTNYLRWISASTEVPICYCV
jgi:secreted trypsin-like serine protease